MPVITVSAVSTGSDTLTVTAHGMTTGTRFRLRNVGGALPAATPALAAVTDYYAIVVDANTVKVSDTNAHALASTGIFDLTGSGSGTTTLEYGLPYCLPTAAAAAGTQIKSANDNQAWAALVAIYDLLTGQAQSIWTSIRLAMAVVITGDLTVGGVFRHGTMTRPISLVAPAVGSAGLTPLDIVLSGASTYNAQLDTLQVGERVTAVRVRIKDASSTTIRARVYSSTDGTASAALATTTTSAGNTTAQTLSATGLTIDALTNVTYHIAFDITSGGGNCHIYDAEYDCTLP